jgi:hypothetical protein
VIVVQANTHLKPQQAAVLTVGSVNSLMKIVSINASAMQQSLLMVQKHHILMQKE